MGKRCVDVRQTCENGRWAWAVIVSDDEKSSVWARFSSWQWAMRCKALLLLLDAVLNESEQDKDEKVNEKAAAVNDLGGSSRQAAKGREHEQ